MEIKLDQTQSQRDWSAAETSAGRRVYTVGQIASAIKGTLQQRFPEGAWVEGEVSNLRIPASGHVYFSLKDAQAVLQAVMFRGPAGRLRFELADGLKVLAFGRITTYEPRGVYQIVAESIEPQGLGSLGLAFEQLKAKLQAAGLFDARRKRPLPMLPTRIAVVTSPTGAAIRDVLKVLGRRFSNLQVGIYPVAVQGEGAAPAMVEALDTINALGGYDMILLTRGGGSLEDLWPFNDERLAHAIARSALPLVSAVGHEVDITIADLVADMRCPTPSAAAEMVVGRKQDFLDRLQGLQEGLRRGLEGLVREASHRLEWVLRSHGFLQTGQLLERYMQRVDDAQATMGDSMALACRLRRKDLEQWMGKIDALSPLAVLGRGYSITFSEDGRVLRKAEETHPDKLLRTRLGEGSVLSRVVPEQDHG